MSESEVRAECAKLGWSLDSTPTYEDTAPYEHVAGVTWTIGEEGRVIGRGSTPKAAYHDACQRQEITPF